MSSPNSEYRKLYDSADLVLSFPPNSEFRKLYDFADLAISSEMNMSDEIQQLDNTGTNTSNTSTFDQKSSPLTSRVPEKDAKSKMSKKKKILREGDVHKPKYHRLSIALSKEEIEEDLLALTGKRPLRFSKRVKRMVKANLDELHPGGKLDGHTAETLRKTYGF